MTLSSCDVGLTFPTVIYCFLTSRLVSIFNISLLPQSPRSGVSEPEPDSPGDSGTDLRHDQHNDVVNKDISDDQSDMEQDDSKPTIGIRSDLLPMHPLPKDGLKEISSLHGLPALEALRRQAGAQGNFLAGLGQSALPSFPPTNQNNRPSQPPTPQSTGSNELGGNWTFEEQFKQVCPVSGPSM